MSAGALIGECTRCHQTKPGPTPVTGTGSSATGGVVVRAGQSPTAPFVCSDCRAAEALKQQGARIQIRDGERWVDAEIVGLGQPDDAITVEDTRVVGGGYRRDVVFVRRTDTDEVVRVPYGDVRERPGL